MPATTYRTDRLRLRSLRSGDLDAVRDLLSDPAVMRFLGPRRAMTAAEIQDWFDGVLAAQDTELTRHVVALAETDELVGFCGALEMHGAIDVGFYLRRAHWGQGYAVEACRAVLPPLVERYGGALEMFIEDDNVASARVAATLGWSRGEPVVRDGAAGHLYRPGHESPEGV